MPYLSPDLFNPTAQTFNHPFLETSCRSDQQTFIEPRSKALFQTHRNQKITFSAYSLNTLWFCNVEPMLFSRCRQTSAKSQIGRVLGFAGGTVATVQLCQGKESSHRPYLHKWAWQCSNKTLLTKTALVIVCQLLLCCALETSCEPFRVNKWFWVLSLSLCAFAEVSLGERGLSWQQKGLTLGL